MSWFAFWGAIELGFIYALVALGVYISFRVLNFPDLTVDGSFPLGAAITAVLLTLHISPFIAMLCAFLLGGMAGLVTAWLNVRFKILHLLASILVMIGLYSINLRIMSGRPNIPLLNEATMFDIFLPYEYLFPSKVVVLCLCIGGIVFLLNRFLHSEMGLSLRAVGNNPRMSVANGIPTGIMIYIGMMISNGLVALAGSFFAQSNGFADVTLGTGTIIIGLASVIIGENLFHTRKLLWILVSCVLGAILYRLAIAFALTIEAFTIQASDLNLITALLVACALIIPKTKKRAHT